MKDNRQEVDKKLLNTFKEGDMFEISCGRNFIGTAVVKKYSGKNLTLHANISTRGVLNIPNCNGLVCFDKEFFRGLSVKKLITEKAAEKSSDLQKVLVGKQYTKADKIGSRFVAIPYEGHSGRVYEIECVKEGVFLFKPSSGESFVQCCKDNVRDDIRILDKYFLYWLKPSTSGLKKVIEEEDKYIVWCPSGITPPNQVFSSEKQARKVAYILSEKHKDKRFYWAKLEGSSRWEE